VVVLLVRDDNKSHLFSLAGCCKVAIVFELGNDELSFREALHIFLVKLVRKSINSEERLFHCGYGGTGHRL
jgi:hypothetical protein